MAALLIGDATLGAALNNANAYLGVGDSSAAFAVGQVDMQAATNKYRQGMVATYPQRTTNVITFRALFPSAQANFVWAEWGIFNASTSGQMATRKVEALGTKTSATAWQLTVTLTVTVA
jgi:hypothetical protein